MNMKEELLICGIPPTTKPPPFVLVLKNKRKIAERIRHQLHEEKLGNPRTMLGKDDDPFQGGKEEKGPSFTGGKQHKPTQRPERLCDCEGVAPAHAPPDFVRGIILVRRIGVIPPVQLRT